MKHYRLLTLIFFLMLLSIGTSFAAVVDLYGPNQFIRDKNKPVIETYSFLGMPGEGLLIVENGESRISSAEITINGEVVIKPNNFNQNVESIEIPISLVTDNKISVELRSKPGSSLTIRVVQEFDAEGGGVIGLEGGIVEITDSNSPLFGVSLHAVEGSVTEPTLFLIGINNKEYAELPFDFQRVGEYIELTSSGQTVFDEPVYLMTPFPSFPQEDDIRVMFTFNEETDHWEPVVPLPTPYPELLVVRLNHFSTYVKGMAINAEDKIKTGFDINYDSFEYINYDNICNGMSFIASKYYNKWVDKEGVSLRCRWDSNAGKKAAMEAHDSINCWYCIHRSLAKVFPWLSGLDYKAFIDYIKIMSKFDKTVKLGLHDLNFLGIEKGHSVVATGWGKDSTGKGDGYIEIYDVNHNDELRKIYYRIFFKGLTPFYSFVVYDDMNFYLIDNLEIGISMKDILDNNPSQDLCNNSSADCGAYVAPGVWKEFDCYNLAAIGKTTGDDPFTPSWRLIGGYWQWGRKGPDPSVWHTTNTPNFAHGPTGPDIEDANEGVIRGWDQTYAPDDAWSDSTKTANDPCLEGFRIPSISQWQGVLENNIKSTLGTWDPSPTNYRAARFFGDDLMLPAAGRRYYNSGALNERGYYGYYWSSSDNSRSYAYHALDLYFLSGDTGWLSSHRLLGFSVRCISE